MSETDRRDAPATQRNRRPILDVLRERLPAGAEVLEISSGTGQHAAWFSAQLGNVRWQPTEHDRSAFPSIEAWGADCPDSGWQPPLHLDAASEDWGVGAFDAVFNANLIHISPWEVGLGLLRGAARHLRPGGALLLYGPFFETDVEPAPSNLAFDESLRARDERWGIRQLDDVVAAASSHGLALAERIPMPANNLTLHFRRE